MVHNQYLRFHPWVDITGYRAGDWFTFGDTVNERESAWGNHYVDGFVYKEG